MLPQALGAPTRSHDAAGTMLIGGLLILFSVVFPVVWLFTLAVSPIWIVLLPLAVFPPLLTLGYDLRVMEAGLRGERATPPFLGWTQLVRDGARSLLLGVVYFVPALLALGAASLIVSGVQTGQLGLEERVVTVVTGVTTAGVGAFMALYVGVFFYVRPATLAVFVATGRLRPALSPRRVLSVALSTNYAIGWTIAAVVLLIGWTIAAPLQLLVVGFFFAFYVRAVSYYAYGNGARTRAPAVTETSLGAETFSRKGATDAEPATVTEPAPATDPGATSATSARSASTSTPPNDRPSLTPSWSPRIDPEPVASVQVGRSVVTPSDCEGPRTDSDSGRNDSGDDADADGSAGGAQRDDSAEDTRADDPNGESGTGEADTNASRAVDNSDTERERSVDDPRLDPIADSSFEWEK